MLRLRKILIISLEDSVSSDSQHLMKPGVLSVSFNRSTRVKRV